MLFRDGDQRAARGLRIDRAGGIVRIDHDERARLRGDQALDVIEIGLPIVGVIGLVVRRLRADLGEDRGVERIRRRRHEHFFAFVDDSREGQLDPFRRARRDQHAIGGDVDAARRKIGGGGFPGRGNTRRRDVAVVSVAHRLHDRFNQMRRRNKSKLVGIANIEITNLLAGGLNFLRLRDDIPDRIRESIDAFGGADG